ncbi:LacI family DNA-binding transcriptional regulator [Dactylosporangium sp. NPDC051541]|uniref:LacI family DNA-binding transcriptional regulator n=1 Tax=Dactylosporangium sp. NPDC051541 TaxID=3363977 RepID=UPI0037939185
MTASDAPARRVTIVDVARQAQVSTTTVSKVLRNAAGASPAARTRVRQAIAELGYRPYAAARGMRGRTYTIGVMLPDIRNPFFADILEGLHERLDGTGYQLLHGSSYNSEDTEARVIDAMIDHGMDGLVLIAPLSSRTALDRIARAAPTVVVGRHGHSALYDTVTDDDHAGAHLVVEHLIALGHRRIALIDHHETDPARLAEMPNAIRARGYRDAMRRHGLADEIDIVPTTYTHDGGYLAAQQLLARPRMPTAVFAGADVVAIGALQALTEAGRRVPADISVAGYDNIALAAFTPLSLTTVDQAGHQIGANAARLLLERFTDRHAPATHIKLSPTLVARRSTAPPAAPSA